MILYLPFGLNNLEETHVENNKLDLRFIMSEIVQLNFIFDDSEILASTANVIFKYFVCESLMKKLMERTFGKRTKKDGRDWSMSLNNVMKVMERKGIKADPEIVDRIFGSEDTNLDTCTVKKLRNRFVHNMTANVLQAIMDRADQINADLDWFLGLVRQQLN